VKITVLGSGTSGGVPRIGNHWGACDPANPKNRRRRVSIAVEQGLTRLIVDTSPDLREQCLDANINRVDGVLYTHDHADHTHGIDDLRALAWSQGGRVPVYADANTLATLMQRFDYVFASKQGYPAICEPHEIDGAFRIGEIPVVPFAQAHGDMQSIGYRFGKAAYSTDLNGLDEAAFEALEGIDLWIVDALRYEPHPTHAHLDLTLSWIDRIKPRHAVLTHMTWDMDYETLKRQLPEGVEPAYDGMVLEID
jgi:phosphoribosyl 1,2-cyclic phosphate phosphodiesterase